jgi:hypothetical protein
LGVENQTEGAKVTGFTVNHLNQPKPFLLLKPQIFNSKTADTLYLFFFSASQQCIWFDTVLLLQFQLHSQNTTT